MSRDTSYIMHALALPCINQQTKFEVPVFTISKDMTSRAIFNKLAPYGTDGRLFATDVSAKFKVT